MTLPFPARLLCAALLSFGLLGSAVPALATNTVTAPSPSATATPAAPSTAPTSPAPPATAPAPSAAPAPAATITPTPPAPSKEAAPAKQPAAQDEVTSFVPDLTWNPLDDPGSKARYGEHYAEPVTPMKTASPLNLDGSGGTAALGPRSGAFKVTLVTVQLSGKTVADTDAINLTAARNSITNANSYWNSA